MATFRNRLLARAGHFIVEEDRVEVDLAAFLRRMILFDQYVLDSVHLREIPQLVAVFGSTGLMTLLNAGALKIQLEATTSAQSGQTAGLAMGPLLPPGSFRLTMVRSADEDRYITHGLEKVQTIVGLTLKQVIKLKRTIVDNLVKSPPEFGYESLAAARIDLGRPTIARQLVAAALKELAGKAVSANDVSVRYHPLEGSDFCLESNLDRFGVDAEMSHRVLERAVCAAASLNFRIEEMKTFEALNGVLDEDLSLISCKFDFLVRELSPGTQEQRLARVLSVAGLPDLPEGNRTLIDAEKLLRLRESPECSEFREWLQRIDKLNDTEVRDRVAGLNARVQTFLRSSTGKVTRFLVTSAAGLVLTQNPVAALTISAIDTFLLDKVFPQNGPAAVVSRLYPSIFRPRL
jgi:hypothetical protein